MSLVSLLAVIDPLLASIFTWNETWAILLAFVDFHLFFIRCGNLRSLWMVYLVVTLSVTLLDFWYFNAKYANYLRDCYNQFPWSLLFPLNWSVWLLFNVIIAWFVTIYLTGFPGHTIVFLVEFLPGILPLFSYLLPTVTTSQCGCWLLSAFPIYNAKCLCFFQF